MESGGQEARWDGRAQAIQLGALLLFAILIINLSLFQVFVVPDQNSEIEFNHNENLQNDMVDIRNNVLETASTGASSPTGVKLGTQYPARTVFVNPANPSGSLRTESLGEVKVLNAEATGEAGDYWDGSDRTFDTKSLVYQPSYNYYTNAPETVYENSVLYNRFDSGTELNVTGQQLVNGRTITLIALQGSASVSKTGSTTVETEPLSAPLRRLPLGRDGGPVTIEIPTQLSEDRWRTLLADELDTPDDASTSDPTDGDYVTFLDCANAPPDPCGTLTLQMEDIGSENYLLRTGAVSVSGNTLSQNPQYVVRVSDQSASLETGAETSLTVEVRDQYNNPVSNVELTGSISGSSPTGSLDSTTQTTDENGEATFEYTAPGSETTDTLIVGFDGVTNPNEPEATEFNIKVESGGGEGDSTAPTATSASANPNTISPGNPFDLTASFDDVGNGGSDILEATWSDPVSSATGDLAAVDSEYDQAREDVEGTVPGTTTSSWSVGDHDIEITGTDANANSVTTQVTVTVVELDAVTLIDDFDTSTSFSDTNWSRTAGTTASEVSIDSDASTALSRTNAVRIDDIDGTNEGIVSDAFDTSSYGSVNVSVAVKQGDPAFVGDNPDPGEDLLFQYRNPSGGWVTAREFQATGTSEPYQTFSTELTAGETRHSNFAVRIVQEQTNGFEDTWFVDETCVAAGTVCPGFSGASATNMDTQANGNGEQTLSFTPDADLPAGKTVTIDLSDAQDATSGNSNQYQVDYQVASATVTSGGGTASFTTRTDQVAVLEYDPASDVSNGTPVTIEITGATTGNSGQQSNPYDVVFDRNDGGTITATFDVN